MSSGKFIIVLDLDETLLTSRPHSPPDGRDLMVEAKRDVWRMTDGTLIVTRPGFHVFLGFILQHFDEIHIFTAAADDYAGEIVKQLFAGVAVTSLSCREACHVMDDCVYKDLTRIKGSELRSIDTPRTYMIDDRHEVSERNVFTRGLSHHKIKPFFGDVNDREMFEACRAILEWKANIMGCRVPESRAP